MWWIICGGLIITLGDIAFKEWVIRGGKMLYFYGFIAYLVGGNLLVQSFKSKNIAVASHLYIIVNILSLTLISTYIYGEKLSPTQYVGMVLAFIAMFLLDMGR